MQFAQPENLWSLLVLIPMLGVYLWWWRWKGELMDRLGDRDLLLAMAASASARRQIARATFMLLGTALICVAFAQPQWGQTNRPIKRTGVDVAFALDLSSSMGARDVAPNRLEAAKDEIETTLEVLRGDRVGLVVFTAISFVQSPLTTDYGAIRFYLSRLEPGQMPLGGTSIGRAVTDAVELLTGKRIQDGSADAADENLTMRRSKNQVVVLITDGEDHESDPRAAADLAKSHNIKLVTVGFGSSDGENIPVYRPDGSLSGYKRDRAGNLVTTRLDSATLEQMAEATGGTYIHYEGENSVANALVNYINALEKTEIETMLKERYRERYAFFALPGLLLLLLSLLLGERRPTRRAAATVMLVATVLGLSGCERAFEDTLGAVDDGNEHIERGEFAEALEAYRRAEKEIPSRPELHFDIGRAQLGLEQWDDAADSFARALETEDISLRFDALNNLGLAHSGKEAWREAWETFRDALVLAARHPGRVDDARVTETRHNLEVAWWRLYPPCSKLEDAHEENDTPATPTKLEEPRVDKATLCGLDDDWYIVAAIPGSTVSVTATFHDLRDEPDEDIPFLTAPADLQIALFDHTGQTALAVDQGSEPLGAERRATRVIERFRVDETMTAPDAAGLLLRVAATELREFKYDLKIESIPPCHALEEQLEDNDSPEESKSIKPGNYQMHLCPGDDDWFAVDLSPGDSFFVDVQTSPDPERQVPADVALEIFDPSQELVAEGTVEGEYLTAGVRDVTTGGRYLIQVSERTRDQQGPYKLDVYQFGACPVGDDRFEENDSANAATALDPGQRVQRYLRACDQDLDFFRVDFTGDDKKVSLGLARISTPGRDIDGALPDFRFDIVSASGDQILVEGGEPAPAQPAPPGVDAPPPLPIARALHADKLEGESAILRVIGEGNEFYHLVQLDPDQQQSQDEQQQQEQQPDQGQDDPNESEEKKDDQQGQQDQQSEEEGQDGEQSPQPDQGNEDQQPKSEDQQDAPQQQTAEEEAQDARLEDLLEALENTDDNFQMRKALENMPGRYIEKDW